MPWEPITDADPHMPDHLTAIRSMAEKSNAAHVQVQGTNKADDGWRSLIHVFRSGGEWFAVESIWLKDGTRHNMVARWQTEQKEVDHV